MSFNTLSSRGPLVVPVLLSLSLALFASSCATTVQSRLEDAEFDDDRGATEWLLARELNSEISAEDREEARRALDAASGRVARHMRDIALGKGDRRVRGLAVRHLAAREDSGDVGFYLTVLERERGERIQFDSGDPVLEAAAAVKRSRAPGKVDKLLVLIDGEREVAKVVLYLGAMSGLDGIAARKADTVLLRTIEASPSPAVEQVCFESMTPQAEGARLAAARADKHSEKVLFEFEFGERAVEGHDQALEAAAHYLERAAAAKVLAAGTSEAAQFATAWTRMVRLSDAQTTRTAHLRESRRALDAVGAALGLAMPTPAKLEKESSHLKNTTRTIE